MKAIVLCAGYGTRLGDLTREIPKPMLPLDGKPLLEYTLQYLASYGFTEIGINLHFLPKQITDYFGAGERFGVSITYSYEPVLLGTAGAVKKLEPWLADVEDFLVLYGDILIDQNLADLWSFHCKKRAMATLLLHQRANSNSLVQMDDDKRIIGLVERPTDEQRRNAPYQWVNSGVYALNRGILEHIPPGQAVDFPRDVFVPLVAEERIYGWPLTGYRCAIDSPTRYEEAQAAVRDGRYRPFVSRLDGQAQRQG